MKIIVVGATGTIGQSVVNQFGSSHEVFAASRNGVVRVDLSTPETIAAMYETVGQVDAVVSVAGSAKFGPLNSLDDEDYHFGLGNKLMGQVNLVRYGLEYLADGGSITLTSGILADQPNVNSVLLTTLNAAVEGFVRAASLNLPRNTRLNVVRPPMIRETAQKMGWGNGGVPANDVSNLYVGAVESKRNGEIISFQSLA